MFKPELITLIHNAAVIQRWNDHIRPGTGFVEMDKQAHKTFYAFVLAKCHEDAGGEVDYVKLIDGIIFEFLHRVILTDIKPPIYHKLKKEMGDKIDEYVECELKDYLEGIKDFPDKMHKYFTDLTYSATERDIIRFAHYLATKWEFDIIYPLNIGMYNIEKTKASIINLGGDEEKLDAIGGDIEKLKQYEIELRRAQEAKENLSDTPV